MGDFKRSRVLRSYACLNSEFFRATREEVELWSKQTEAAKQAWLSVLYDPARRQTACERLVQLQSRIDLAFGRGFCDAYGSCAWAASKYSYDSYMAMTRRICVICKGKHRQCRATGSHEPTEALSYVFAHADCQRAHAASLSATTLAHTSAICPIRRRWSPRRVDDAALALTFFHSTTPRCPTSFMNHMSILTRYKNSDVPPHLPVVLWVAESKYVRAEDTLTHALSIDRRQQREYFEEASRVREIASRLAAERLCNARKARAEADCDRDAEFRLLLGKADLAWRTPEEIDAFHESAMRLVRYEEAVYRPRLLALSNETAMLRLRFLSEVFGPRSRNAPLHACTINFFLDRDHVLRPMVPRTAARFASAVARATLLVDGMDRLTDGAYDVCHVARTRSGHRDGYRVTCVTRLGTSRSTRVVFNAPADAFELAHARLRLAGVDFERANIHTWDASNGVGPTEMNALASIALRTPGCRRIAYELLGLEYALDAHIIGAEHE